MLLNKLDSRERLRLMKFVCSFAWADLTVRPAERAFVAQLIRRRDLGDDEKDMVRGWLEIPPSPSCATAIVIVNLWTSSPGYRRVVFMDQFPLVALRSRVTNTTFLSVTLKPRARSSSLL